MQADIVIIGSGISGLTAASILARKGQQVVVIEKQRRIGGALKRFKRKGIAFDVGFHYTGCLREDQILSKLWQYCGALEYINTQPFPPQSSDRLYIEGSDSPVDAFFSYKHQSETLRQRFPQEKEAIETYFTTVANICSKIPFYAPEVSISEFLRGYRASPVSVKQFLTSITSNPELQAVLACPALLYGIATDNVSIDVHAMVAHGYYLGAFGISGGGQSIADAFKKSCEQHGVVFLTSETVKTIHFDDNGITGVDTESSKKIQCDKVVYTGHPSQLIQMVDKKAFRPAYRKRLSQLKNTLSMNILFGSIDQPASLLDWNNHIYLPKGPNPFDIKFNHLNDRPLMLTSTERQSNSLRGHNKSVILLQPARWDEVKKFANTRQGQRPADYLEHKKNICNLMINSVKNFIDPQFPTIKPLTVGTPVTIRDELTAPEGAAYGASHSLDQFTPDIRTRLPGLLLSGQSTIMTGIAGASLAGFVSAGHILGLDSLWQEVKQCG